MYSAPTIQVQVEPLDRPIENAITQRDYMLLQHLLQREKQAKEDRLREQVKQQYALQEQKQYELALYRLAYLQARERQQREERIQRAIQAYRQKQLIRAVEEQVYRQKIAAALEQRQNEMLRRRFLQNLRAKLAERRDESPRPRPIPRHQSSFDDYKAKQMCQVLRHCFGDQTEEKQVMEDDRDPDWVDEEEDEDEEALHASLWDRMTLTDNQSDQEEEEEQEVTGRTHFPRAAAAAAPPDHKTISQTQEEPDYYPRQNDRLIEEQAYDQEQALQNFLRQLVQNQNEGDKVLVDERQQEEEKPSSSTQPTHLGGFIPEDIITEAEPTPADEFSQDPLAQDMQDSTMEEGIANDEKHDQISSPQVDDDAKQTQMNKLASIEHQLCDIQSKHATQPLGPLTFEKTSKHKALPATTKANKEFLQREEELVQLLLQLDAIDSFGQDDIRQRRKHAVTSAEKLLSNLDNYKSSSS